MYTYQDSDLEMVGAIFPDEEMRSQAVKSLQYADSYYSTSKSVLVTKNKSFTNDLIYSIIVMAVENYFIALLSRYDVIASHHMPLALFKEAEIYDKELNENMKKTTILIGKFESICSLDGFGYHTPEATDLLNMVEGLNEIKNHVTRRVNEILVEVVDTKC